MLTLILAQSGQFEGPLGPEFGKASPVGLFLVVAALAMVLFLGYRLTQRIARLHRRQKFAEDHGLDVFDTEAVDKALRDEGLDDIAKHRWL